MRKILVPIAYWETCRMALRYAGQLALRMGASLTVLHVATPPRETLLGRGLSSEKWEDWGVEPPGFELLRRAQDSLQELGLFRLDEREQPVEKHALKAIAYGLYEVHLVGGGGQDVRFRLREGPPVREILREAEDPEYDLILMGTRGHTGLRRWWLGSVAQEVALHAPCSVLVAKNLRPDRGLLVGVTGRETALEAVRQAGAIAGALSAPLVLLAVIPEEGGRSEAERSLREARSVLPPELAERAEERVRVGDPAQVLLREAGEEFVLVLGRLRRSKVKEMLLGDISLKILEQSQGPVLIAASPRSLPTPATGSEPGSGSVPGAGER